MACDKTIVIVGGSGVFGSRLAAGLVQDGFTDVVIAGRDLARATRTAKALGARAVALDISSDALDVQVAALTPWLVIDAAGPFQAYGSYRLGEAAIAAGAHYFDLSDDGPFTAGIEGALDAKARAAGVIVRSGVSSVPALSAAVVRALSHDLSDVKLIETMILPGNRAPRGLSVMRAILSQAGRPMVNGEFGWVGTRKAHIGGLTRLASPIGAPDLHLMPRAFNASDVRFFAGLELRVMHRGLAALAQIVNTGFLKNGAFLARPMRWAAMPLYYFGSDTGAMRVRVIANDPKGQLIVRQWALIATGGDGPHVPALPARVLAGMLRDDRLQPSACAELSDLILEEIEAHAPLLRLTFEREEAPFIPMFQACLGRDFDLLPDAIKDLHWVIGRRNWQGKATVTKGTGLGARIVAWLLRFPKAGTDIPLSVHMDRTDNSEMWTRSFGAQSFRSELRPDAQKAGRMWERLGLFTFAIDFKADETGVTFPVAKGRFLGVSIPKALLPKSDTEEGVDATGRATFSVRLSMPLIGPVVHYRGWLEPAQSQPIIGDQLSSFSS